MKSWSSFSQELTEKKAKKDYDGDGKIESGSKEHAGVVHNAIQRAKGKKADGQDTRKEELEIEEGKYSGSKSHIQRDGTASAPERTAAERKKDRRILAGYGKGGMKDAVERAKKERDERRKSRMKKEEFQSIEEKKNGGDNDPCWDSHKQVGMKKKGGRMVPNCVPKEETELQELDIKGAVTGALNKGSEFMKKNPVGRAVGNVLKPVGAGRGTARPSVRTLNTIRQNQQSQMNSFEPEGDMIGEGETPMGQHPSKSPDKKVRDKYETQRRRTEAPAGVGVPDKSVGYGQLKQSFETEGEMTEGILGGAGLIAGGLAAYKAIKGMQTVNKMKNDAKSGKGLAGRLQNRTNTINKALGNSFEPEGEMVEGYDKPDEKLKTGRKMFTIPDEERSAAAARLKEKARKKREEKCKKEELEIQEGSCGSSKKKKKKTYKEEAESKAQQRLMGLALSVKRGDTPMSSVTPQVARMAREMKEKDLKDFAGTKHDGLPEKVKKEEPEVSSPLVESLVESAVQRMAAKARRETAADKRLNRQASSAQQRAELNAKK